MSITSHADKQAIFIDDDTQLSQLIEDLKSSELLHVDTEFERTRTYFPQLALLQVHAGSQVYLIDPLKINVTNLFLEVFADPDVNKWMHSCSEDLQVLDRENLPIVSLLDTQVAASFLGLGYGLGYARLVEELTGVTLCKDQARSDWLKRPLQEEQIEYAAADVIYLAEISQMLENRLKEENKFQWFVEECDWLVDHASLDFEGLVCRVKGNGRLNLSELGLLKLLTIWREERAMSENLPKGWIAPDAVILQLAVKPDSTFNELIKQKGIRYSHFKRHGPALLDFVSECLDSGWEPLDSPCSLPNDPTIRGLMKELRAYMAGHAQRLGIDETMLASKSLIQELVLSLLGGGQSPRLINGWRYEAYGDEVSSFFTNKLIEYELL
ncbi:MAG: ribonuclease D [bacterium]